MRRYTGLILLLLWVALPACHTRKKLTRHKESERTVTHSNKPAGQKKYTPESYIDTWKAVAIKQMHKNGIPASITLAQALLESANGNSELAREANNHFGIKCTKDWTGRTYHHGNDRDNDCFRSYKDAGESFADHSAFLKKGRYASLYDLGPRDYKGWAKGLKKCGYATNPKYPELLINMIDKYDLSQYDRK